ncbi:unnamed protein product [Ceutorhynchus assimilis]|uniref:Peptidase S1 domain-containing protein n=1 Tax=Ceutorhynchus assimilis TaxID=467358 RepID=A0A9N9MW20_9CUCU|nr:unnamed protein product [Ceutorhynchus assimilis]
MINQYLLLIYLVSSHYTLSASSSNETKSREEHTLSASSPNEIKSPEEHTLSASSPDETKSPEERALSDSSPRPNETKTPEERSITAETLSTYTYPYVVKVESEHHNQFRLLGGGTLIAPAFVLTSGIVTDLMSSYRHCRIVVLADRTKNSRTVNIKKNFTHPTKSVALLELSESLHAGPGNIGFVTLPNRQGTSNFSVEYRGSFKIMGFGFTQSSFWSIPNLADITQNILRGGYVAIVPNKECEEEGDNVFCFKLDTNNVHPSSSDRGGPLIYEDKQVGIIGIAHKEKLSMIVNAKVAHYLDFIEETIDKSSFSCHYTLSASSPNETKSPEEHTLSASSPNEIKSTEEQTLSASSPNEIESTEEPTLSASGPDENESPEERLKDSHVCKTGQYPYVVKVESEKSNTFYCMGAGTLIAPQFVLTSAVVTGYMSQYHHGRIVALADQENPLRANVKENFTDPSNSIALLKLSESLDESDGNIKFAPLVDRQQYDVSNFTLHCKTVEIMGYGLTKSSSWNILPSLSIEVPNVLYCSFVTLISNEQCKEKFRALKVRPTKVIVPEDNEDSYLCFELKQADSHPGVTDFGGPILCHEVQVGIIGYYYEKLETTTINAKVEHYLDFIDKIMEKNSSTTAYSGSIVITIIIFGLYYTCSTVQF